MANASFVPRNDVTGSPDYASVGLTGPAYSSAPVAPSPSTSPGAAVAALNASREAAYNNKQDVYAGPNQSYSSFITANPQYAVSAPVGTLNAQIMNPSSLSKTAPAPAVVTGDAATKDLDNKKAQIAQLQADTANHQAIVNVPPVAPTTPAQTDTTKNQQPMTLDDQISEALGGLQQNDKNIDQNAQNQVTPLQQQQQQLQTQLDTDAASALTKLNSIASGTYPLSPAESDLLTSTRATYMSTISAQQTANTAFEGQTAETMASLGISTSAPTQALGLMHAVISSGNEKVAGLNAQMSQSLAQLQLGFQKEDYAEVSDAWDKTSTYMTNRIKTIQDMQTAVMDAAKQQKQDNKDYTTLALQYIAKSADFTYQQKQDAIDNAFKGAQIDETQRHNLQTESVARSTENRLNGDTPNAGFKLTSTQTSQLLSGGFTASEANQIANDVATHGIDATVNGLSSQQADIIRRTFAGSDAVSGLSDNNQFLSTDYFSKLFTDDQLKTAAADAGYRHLLTSWGTEKENYLGYLMDTVNQYRKAGLTDQDILKQMQ